MAVEAEGDGRNVGDGQRIGLIFADFHVAFHSPGQALGAATQPTGAGRGRGGVWSMADRPGGACARAVAAGEGGGMSKEAEIGYRI